MDMHGRKILVVEDDFLQAQEIGNFFRTTGADVLGPALTLGDAMGHIHSADAAILDLDISGDAVFPVAEALARRDVPFVFYTGRRHDVPVPNALRHAEIFSKPVSVQDLGRAVDRLRAPDESAADSVEQCLPLLRAWSRLLLSDPASADRLVERTLLEAIRAVREGELPDGAQSRMDWLYRKCETVLVRDGTRLMH
ncbi:response regulator [Roseivivax sediminis]|uniref:Response regulatory domain-containing protein n=1 Tax=Roseivivax sediminis TaxID=936889 RepID=A0A1I1VKQ1_9RHOB|nr:response regulator [Roseivivax sediminis]SFD83449.1 hypothetical protein SAMN04515678_103258 [Roseivivax sediminis]